jgi:predicted metal-dependent phosphoesterase TrpH
VNSHPPPISPASGPAAGSPAGSAVGPILGRARPERRLHALSNADLHCHSRVSDGTLEPEDVAKRAAAGGVELWSLTDHDEVGGQARALKAAHALGLAYLTGVEVSVTFAGVTVHIVGLGFDADDAQLKQGLRSTRGGRQQRAQEMAHGLAAVGIKGGYEGALKYVGNPDLISRTHFARFLVDSGVCSDVGEVFRRFLTEGKPGFVPHRWARLGDAVRWIREAGGMAVIAHPARYAFTPTEEYALFSEFKAHGGQGVEVVTGSHSADEYVRYADMAQEFDLLASRGSDFHSPGESRTELGSLPPLPGACRPIWEALSERVQWPI